MGYHYAPRKYLLGFCEPGAEGWLWVYDRKYKQFKRKNVGGVAQEKGFYSDQDEADLNRIVETPANPILDKLRDGGSITKGERARLAVYIATTIYRVPSSRSLSLKAAPVLFEQTIESARKTMLSEAKRLNIAPEKLQRKLAELEAFRAKHATDPAVLIPDQIRTPWPSKQVCRLVNGMTWRFLETGGPTNFLTTDNPVFFFGSLGLGQTRSELLFPISSGLMLHGWWRIGPQAERMAVDQACVAELNRHMASKSTRFLFYSRQEDWVTAIGDSFPLD